MKPLNIILPAFNEEKGIRNTLEKLLPVALQNDWDVTVINDGSIDETEQILKEISGIHVFNHPYNKGYGAALKTGIRNSSSEYVAFFDADGQHNSEDLVKLYSNINNFDMLIGERNHDSHQNWSRRPGKWLLSKTANFLSGKKIPDINSGLRIIKRSAINRVLHLMPDGFSFSTTSTITFYTLGHDVAFYPITVNKRIGRSTVRQLKHGSNTILLILRLIILFNPLKVFIPASILVFILGIIYEIIYAIILIPGVKILPTSLLAFIVAILIFFFGLVVDQISELRKHLNVNE